ncbi:hypothetical protein GUITHDRAFT_69453 [Guillardia theta CCMP2712]|uniref:type I protein arginine methyltransferase n=1 Tax=Guillardia theta (strain CCMP2712) TaxID=905079 RepID=L1JGG1_GUITC|nr:hypothetical protein GUITHDRAFT_69453 [Guillardia theta CCMP2712]EKX47586.1 hypothetical protein GUITHDRAFT_69453 [Guillardia theta CCMP2712]|eukprot:XP_005834566.1 hypothetical protein GUITHDRAFT_69453 [Guillardia theta CCMP2712]
MGGEEGKKAVIDKHYFESYAKIGIHHEMLSDRVRTESYRSFLLNNPSLVKDKVVLDVGCGTGILSLFAAQAGAKHVYSIDMSDIIDEAREIVRENGMAEKITLIRGKVEEITLPVEKVDLIVSEWMGYFLLYESMLDSVIEARKRFLRPGGACMPDKCSMHITAIEDSESDGYLQRLSFWDDVYGFDIRSLSTEGTVDFYKESQVISSTSVINKFDCNVVEVKDLEFVGEFRLEVTRSAKLDALLTYFDIEFAGGCDQVVSFTTGPQERMEEQTHWKQTSFYLDEELEVQQGDIVAGELHCKRHSKNPRALEVLIKWEVKRGEHKVKSKFQTYVVE